MTRRICLFAGFHPKNQISDYVVYYVRALAELADVYYLADSDIPDSELAKLAPYTKGAWAYRHKKYDFGSWQELIHKLGWDTLAQYDECMFVNDSSFAPLFPLKPIVEKASQADLDAWALNSFEQDYMGSFFWVLRKKALLSRPFQQLMESVTQHSDVGEVIRHYEKRLPEVLRQAGCTYKVFCNTFPNVYNSWRELVLYGFPVFKLKVLVSKRLYPERVWLPGWREFLRKNTDYPVALIEQHLRSIDIDPNQFDTTKFKLKSVWWAIQRVRRKAFRVHFCRGAKILVLFGITLISTDPPEGSHIDAF